MQYYGRFYLSALCRFLARINAYLVRWIRNKYRRYDATRAAGAKLVEVTSGYPRLFRHWQWITTGDGHAGFCGSRRVKLPPATRPCSGPGPGAAELRPARPDLDAVTSGPSRPAPGWTCPDSPEADVLGPEKARSARPRGGITAAGPDS